MKGKRKGTHAEAQPLFLCRISPYCGFSLLFFLFYLSPFTSLIAFPSSFFIRVVSWSPHENVPSFVLLYCLFRNVQGTSITQIHGVVIFIVYNAQASNLLSEWVNVDSENLFSFIPHMRIPWQMSTVQAHRVIKFRFIRLISIVIKTLTPPYAIKGPRRLFSSHEEQDG